MSTRSLGPNLELRNTVVLVFRHRQKDLLEHLHLQQQQRMHIVDMRLSGEPIPKGGQGMEVARAGRSLHGVFWAMEEVPYLGLKRSNSLGPLFQVCDLLFHHEPCSHHVGIGVAFFPDCIAVATVRAAHEAAACGLRDRDRMAIDLEWILLMGPLMKDHDLVCQLCTGACRGKSIRHRPSKAFIRVEYA